MRLVVGVFALSVLGSLAHADSPAPPEPASAAPAPHVKIPLRVVRVMPESHQALLYDRERSTHVLAELGGTVEGYTVDDIDDDEVSLSRDGKQVVLAAPVYRRRLAAEAADGDSSDRRPVRSASAAAPAAGPLDPYGDAPAPAAAPASENGIRVVHAPDAVSSTGPLPADPSVRVAEAPDAGPVRVASAAGNPSPAPRPPAVVDPAPAPAVSAASAPEAEAAPPPVLGPDAPPPAPTAKAAKHKPARKPPSVADTRIASEDKQTADARALADIMSMDAPAKPAPAKPALDAAAPAHHSSGSRTSAAATSSITLPRSELDAALSDFGALSTSVTASFSGDGLVLQRVNDGTIFQRAGLRSGDVITSIDGTPLRSLDDAATLYARLAGASSLTAQLLRNGKPVALHLAIQ